MQSTAAAPSGGVPSSASPNLPEANASRFVGSPPTLAPAATHPVAANQAHATSSLLSSTLAPATSAPAAAPLTTLASTKSGATQRKVAKLLEITSGSDVKDLACYVDNILPGYFHSVSADDGTSKETSEAASANGGKAITAAALRSALDHRTIDMHKTFLHEFAAVYDNFQRLAANVNELQTKCTGLEKALSTSTGGAAGAADDFFYQIQMHQAELQLVQHHEKEVDDFRKQHHFGPAEQQVLEEGPVDMNFLNVLERAREVHRRSRELMHAQEYHQGAAAVMESTYAAIARAAEKIARHLLATAGTAAGGGSRGDASAVATTGGGVGAIAADVPEVTGFQLRCVRVLYEESPSLHGKFLDEVARLRRASVLRRYFHLLTTGSANTASGLYQSGGQPRGEMGDGDRGGMGSRPLEAELNNPTYFFSSLCAWLHQTIVEEQDFLHTFFMSDELDAASQKRGAAQQTGAPVAAIADAERVRHDAALQHTLLDSVFGGVCKHIRAALDNALERLGRSASALGAAESEGQASGGEGGGNAAETAAASTAPHKGPRGLTGGLTRLFMAATGRAPLAPFRRKESSDAGAVAVLQRYSGVTTRAQQTSVAAAVLHAPLQGVQTCVTLVQLFEYYSVTTFSPLLGETSALTKLISETAPLQTREVFQRLLRVLSAHLLDSTAGVMHRTATLRRLASSNALRATTSAVEGEKAAPVSTPSVYILDFLTSMTYGEEAEGGGGAANASLAGDSRADFGGSVSSASAGFLSLPAPSANARFRQASEGQLQRHSAQDLRRVLSQLILPPSPEVEAYCSVLSAVLRDTARQADLLAAIADQQRVVTPSGETAEAPFRLHTEVRSITRELLQSLWWAAQSAQEDAALRSHLDDPCRAILQYNILFQLQGVMEENGDVLELLCAATDSTTQEGGAGGEDAMREELETLRAEVGAAMNSLRRRLLSHWEEAVARFYFPLSAGAATTAAAAADNASAAEADDAHQMGARKDMRRVLKQVVNVYNTVASMGHLPEPVPLLPALCGSEAMRREVSAEITKSIVERVYPAQFSALQRLPPSDEVAAVQAEMSPQNLTMLVDFSSPTTSGAV